MKSFRPLFALAVPLALVAARASSAVEAAQTTEAEAPSVVCPEGADATVVPQGVIRRQSTTLGTKVELGVSGITCELAVRAFTQVFDSFARLEQMTDASLPDSPLARINAAAGKEAVVVDAELFALIQLALGFAEHTEGAFDPTFASLSGLWVFDGGPEPKVPSDEEIAARRALVDYKKVKLDEAKQTVMLEQEGMKLGLGGIVKGYAVDKAVNVMRDLGVSDFIIKSGGELYVAGNPGGGYRKVGLPDPRSDKNYALVDVRDRALNTSSDDDRFFVKDGQRYHHIIDPRTGKPAGLTRTVSLLSVDATSADALSTAVFVLGPEKGLALVEELAGVEAILVDANNRVHVSSGLSDRIVIGAPTP